MRTSKFSPRIRGELEGGKIKPVSFSTKASGIVKYLEKPYRYGDLTAVDRINFCYVVGVFAPLYRAWRIISPRDHA